MRRRSFLTAAAISAFAALSLSAFPEASRAEPVTVEYEPGVVAAALASDKAVLLDYSARWCGTCAAQKRALDNLRAADPAYDEQIVFVRVDWDTFKRADVTTSRNVPRRSTLILLRGEEELGRIIANTREADIKALLDLSRDAS